MAGITKAERRAKAVEKAREMLLDESENTMVLFLAAINGEPGWEGLPAQTRANMLMRAMDYQQGKPSTGRGIKAEEKAAEEPPEEQGLQIA